MINIKQEKHFKQLKTNNVRISDYGEDEPTELCLQMEINQCHPEKEFRCQNGLCILMTMTFTGSAVCSDYSDEMKIFDTIRSNSLLEICLQYPSLECDEINREWNQFHIQI